MSVPPTNAEKLRRLPWSLAHGVSNAVFAQLTFFGPVFILFLDELGLPKTRIGFLLSLLPFSGLLALFIAPVVARVGVKRVFLFFWTLRKLVTAFLLFTPWMLNRFGADSTFWYVALLVALFALCRAIAETAFYPWYQEIIPNSIRGQYSAIAQTLDTLAGILALAAASYVIGHLPGLQRFMVLLGIGVVFGFICVVCALPIPGGAPGQRARSAHLGQLYAAWQDANFRRYLGGLGLVTLAVTLFSFVPLFMREQAGLAEGQILLLQVSTYAGGMLSSYLWGWAADRYGSRPVVQSSLFLLALLPVGWLLLPRHSPWSFTVAVAIALLVGVASFGWYVGNNRQLFVNVVPPEHRIQYMALYYAWIGLLGGLGPLVSGVVLDRFASLDRHLLIFSIDAYAPLFVAALCLLLLGRACMGRVQTDSTMPASAFVGLFVRGNPFMAFKTLIRYRLARDERSRVQTTEELGESHSPLNRQELLEALADPSFNVRFEAIVSIARTPPHPQLTSALVQLLDSGAADLSPSAAWALGRTGSCEAIPALRATLNSDYPLLRAQSARALGRLGDVACSPLLLQHLRAETDLSLKVAYAAALGQLRIAEAAEELFEFLDQAQAPALRGELALALARLLDEENRFVRLWRRAGREVGTVLAQELTHLLRPCRQLTPADPQRLALLEGAAQDMAQEQLEQGALKLGEFMDHLPLKRFASPAVLILRRSAAALAIHQGRRLEYLVLAILALHAALGRKLVSSRMRPDVPPSP